MNLVLEILIMLAWLVNALMPIDGISVSDQLAMLEFSLLGKCGEKLLQKIETFQ